GDVALLLGGGLAPYALGPKLPPVSLQHGLDHLGLIEADVGCVVDPAAEVDEPRFVEILRGDVEAGSEGGGDLHIAWNARESSDQLETRGAHADGVTLARPQGGNQSWIGKRASPVVQLAPAP